MWETLSPKPKQMPKTQKSSSMTFCPLLKIFSRIHDLFTTYKSVQLCKYIKKKYFNSHITSNHRTKNNENTKSKWRKKGFFILKENKEVVKIRLKFFKSFIKMYIKKTIIYIQFLSMRKEKFSHPKINRLCLRGKMLLKIDFLALKNSISFPLRLLKISTV